MADKKVRFINLNNQILTLGGDGILSFPDIATMASEPIANLQNGAIGWVDSEQKYFQWLDTNEISEMGYWKELIFGSDFQISDPTTSADDDRYKGKVVQYVGEDDLTTGFKKGYFYESRLSNTINYVETVCTETSTGTYYILRDGEYLEVVLLGDGTTFDPDETYYKKQDVEVYGWFYINALRVDTELADTDYAIANKTVKAKFEEIIQDYTDKNDELREYVDNDLTTSLQQYADNKIADVEEVTEDKVWSNSKTKDYVDTTLEDYTKSATEILQADYDALDEETKLANNYHCMDSGRMYYKGILYGDKKPIELTYEEYKTLEEAGLIEEDVDYIIKGNQSGVLLGSEDISHGDITVHEALVTLEEDVTILEEDVVTLKTDVTTKQDNLSMKKAFIRRNASTSQYCLLATINLRTLNQLMQPLRLKGVIGNMANDIVNVDITINGRQGFTPTMLFGTITSKSGILTNYANILINKSDDEQTAYVYIHFKYSYAYCDLEIYLGSSQYEVPPFRLTDAMQGTAYTNLLDNTNVVVEHVISDQTTSGTSTWSSSKIASEITNNTNATFLIRDIAAGGENEKTVSFKIRKDYFVAYYVKRTFLLSANIYSLGFSKPVIGLVEIFRSSSDNYAGYVVNLQDTRYTNVTVTVNGDYLEIAVTLNSYEDSGCMVSCSSLSNVPIT